MTTRLKRDLAGRPTAKEHPHQTADRPEQHHRQARRAPPRRSPGTTPPTQSPHRDRCRPMHCRQQHNQQDRCESDLAARHRSFHRHRTAVVFAASSLSRAPRCLPVMPGRCRLWPVRTRLPSVCHRTHPALNQATGRGGSQLTPAAHDRSMPDHRLDFPAGGLYNGRP